MNLTECPQCGSPVKPSQKKCDYCKSEFFVTSIAYLSNYDKSGLQKYLKYYKALSAADPQNPEGLMGLGLCHLQLGLYPLAKSAFEAVIDNAPDIAQAYYYYSLSVIAGRRIKILSMNDIEQIETYLMTAMTLDDENKLYPLLLMLIKYDFYKTNGMLEQSPTFEELQPLVSGTNFNPNEIERLKASAKVSDFDLFGI